MNRIRLQAAIKTLPLNDIGGTTSERKIFRRNENSMGNFPKLSLQRTNPLISMVNSSDVDQLFSRIFIRVGYYSEQDICRNCNIDWRMRSNGRSLIYDAG